MSSNALYNSIFFVFLFKSGFNALLLHPNMHLRMRSLSCNLSCHFAPWHQVVIASLPLTITVPWCIDLFILPSHNLQSLLIQIRRMRPYISDLANAPPSSARSHRSPSSATYIRPFHAASARSANTLLSTQVQYRMLRLWSTTVLRKAFHRKPSTLVKVRRVKP